MYKKWSIQLLDKNLYLQDIKKMLSKVRYFMIFGVYEKNQTSFLIKAKNLNIHVLVMINDAIAFWYVCIY